MRWGDGDRVEEEEMNPSTRLTPRVNGTVAFKEQKEPAGVKQSSGGDFQNLSERPPKEPEKSDRPQPAIDSIGPYTCARFSP